MPTEISADIANSDENLSHLLPQVASFGENEKRLHHGVFYRNSAFGPSKQARQNDDLEEYDSNNMIEDGSERKVDTLRNNFASKIRPRF